MRLSATRLSATGGNKGQLPFNKFISALLSKSGRVAAYYGESWDEILAYNAAQVAAGTPANCVAFEDSAGTIPLLAPLGSGKGCGLLKDRSGGNHHRSQTSATARGEMSRRVNLFFATDNYNNVAWNKVRASISPVAALAPDGTLTASKLVEDTTAAADHSFRGQIVAGVAGATYLQSVYLKAGERTSVQFYEVGGPGTFLVNLLNGVVTVIGGASVVNTVDAGSGWWKISYTQVANNAAPVFIYFGLANPSLIYTGDGVSGVYMWHPSVTLVADSALPYQRVTTATDYDEEGFPARWKLKTDDWAKSSISPVGANRAFVLAALRVNSSASLGVLAEYGPTAASTDGTFSLESLSSKITLRVRGASAGTTVSASVADSSYVVIGALIDLASPRQELFINGVSAGVSTAAIGSTTFVARDLFVAARNGASSFANADSTAPLMAVFMQPSDPGLTSAEIARLTRQFNKSIKAF